MEEEQNNYFSSTLIFKMVIAPPPTSLPDLKTCLTILSGRVVKYFKNGASVDFFAPNFSNDFFWKSGASKSTLTSILKNLKYFNSFLSPLSNKRALALLFLDRGDKYLNYIKKELF